MKIPPLTSQLSCSPEQQSILSLPILNFHDFFNQLDWMWQKINIKQTRLVKFVKIRIRNFGIGFLDLKIFKFKWANQVRSSIMTCATNEYPMNKHAARMT